jgi:small-conductance mechanosensitive channel
LIKLIQLWYFFSPSMLNNLASKKSQEASMGYFDALTSASFKTAADGRKLFYPYGIIGRGYVLTSDAEYEKLRGSYKTIVVIGFVIIICSAFLFSIPLLMIPLVFGFIIGYILWARVHCRNLERANEKLGYGEALKNETVHLSLGLLWFFEVLSILLILWGVIILIADPSQWLLAVGLIVLFTVIAIVYGRMIRAKKRQAAVSK